MIRVDPQQLRHKMSQRNQHQIEGQGNPRQEQQLPDRQGGFAAEHTVENGAGIGNVKHKVCHMAARLRRQNAGFCGHETNGDDGKQNRHLEKNLRGIQGFLLCCFCVCRGDHRSPGRKCCVFIGTTGEFATFTRDDVGIVPYGVLPILLVTSARQDMLQILFSAIIDMLPFGKLDIFACGKFDILLRNSI